MKTQEHAVAEKTDQKQRGKPFQRGRSGNPKGRPPGARNRATVLVERLLDGQAEALTQKAVELALGGDVTALRLCLERILPPRKQRPVRLALPATESAQDVLAAMTTVIAETAAGHLTPDEGTAFASLLERQRQMIDTAELEGRLEELSVRYEELALKHAERVSSRSYRP
ncbi:MAG: hypothetical protein HYZ50_20015 [Deltaproteobacteria bacterium]|nr:hypothetical protein [Deltaproteobacteria bacterium]